MKKRWIGTVIGIVVSLALVLTGTCPAARVSMISKDELKASLGKPNMVILDVRPPSAWMFSMSQIQGAVRESPSDVGLWQKKYSKDQLIVLYCYSDVTSSGVAQQLMSTGFQKIYVLKGGWQEWSAAKYPVEIK